MKKDLRGTLAMMLAVMMLFSLVPAMAFDDSILINTFKLGPKFEGIRTQNLHNMTKEQIADSVPKGLLNIQIKME